MSLSSPIRFRFDPTRLSVGANVLVIAAAVLILKVVLAGLFAMFWIRVAQEIPAGFWREFLSSWWYESVIVMILWTVAFSRGRMHEQESHAGGASPLRKIVRVVTWSALALICVAAIGVVVLVRSCNTHDQVAAVRSPDGLVEARLVEGNGGATTSFSYDVGLVDLGDISPSEKFVASFYGAVRSECAYGVDMAWEGPRRLVITYLRAKSQSGSRASVEINGRIYEVELRSGVSNAKAPCGGMHYNQTKGGQR